MKNSKKQIAMKRMEILFNNALSNAKNNPVLSQRQAEIAKKISLKFKIKMPFEISLSFCKKCKKFIAPGIASKIRLGSKPKSIRITCNFCNHTYRKIISNDQIYTSK